MLVSVLIQILLSLESLERQRVIHSGFSQLNDQLSQVDDGKNRRMLWCHSWSEVVLEVLQVARDGASTEMEDITIAIPCDVQVEFWRGKWCIGSNGAMC